MSSYGGSPPARLGREGARKDACDRADLSVIRLHHKAFRCKMVEMYVASAEEVKDELNREIDNEEPPHLDQDVRIDKLFAMKYMCKLYLLFKCHGKFGTVAIMITKRHEDKKPLQSPVSGGRNTVSSLPLSQ